MLPLGAGPAALPPPGRCLGSGQGPSRGAPGAGAAAAAGGSARRPARPGGMGRAGCVGAFEEFGISFRRIFAIFEMFVKYS